MRKDNGIVGKPGSSSFQEIDWLHSVKKCLYRKKRLENMNLRSDVAVITLGRSGGENYENGYIPITQIELRSCKRCL